MSSTPQLFQHVILGLGVGLGIWLLGWLLARLSLPRIAQWLSRSPTDLDDLLLAAIRPHLPLWLFVLGAVVGARFGRLAEDPQRILDRSALVIVVLSASFALAAFAGRIASRALNRVGHLPATSLVEHVIRIVIVSIGAMVVLTNLGIAIAPILTALGVGSLAIALALQPTLANLFAGFYLALTRQMRIGDFVELETGQRGIVSDIGWRTTHLHDPQDCLVIVPNAKLAELIVRNYSRPDPEYAVVVPVGAGYGADLERVEELALKSAREAIASVEGGDSSFQPHVRFSTLGDSSVSCSVTLRARSYAERSLVAHEFIKRLHAEYRRDGIEPPFPRRVVQMSGAADAGR
jgi:small-conductance mechanosensitive channel